MIGEILGEGFVIERAAGRGGMGRVFLGRDQRTGAPVAVKVLHPTVSSSEPPARSSAGLNGGIGGR